MTRPFVPQPILDAAHERAAARAARDWATADRLLGLIEAAGWRVVDRGTGFRLEPAHPPDLEDGSGLRYGRSDAVPSRLAEPYSCRATVVLVASERPDDLGRALDAMRATAPPETEIVVIVDGPETLEVGEPAIEVVRTSAWLGLAAAWNIGIRRAGGRVVVVMDSGVEPSGDIVSPLVTALGDGGVAVAGAFGLRSADLRRFDACGAGDAAAIGSRLMAFRRADAAILGPLDEAFRIANDLDIWWSLVLRDRGADLPPRRAVVVGDLPLVLHEPGGRSALPEAERTRLARRNHYRVINRFRGRTNLSVP